MKRLILSIASLPLLSFALPAIAQQSPVYDERVLIQLYQAQERRSQPDAYVEKRITEERAKIRTQADKEVKSIVEPATKEESTADQIALPKAIDRQRLIVTTLEENLRDRTVDIDLLADEEQKYYRETLSGTGAIDDLQTTKSYPELKAKKAILEERINALEAGLTLQRDRLGKLTSDQRWEQFSGLFGVLFYVLIIIIAVIIDRVIRRRIVKRIADKGRRYIVAKVVSASIYTIAIVFMIGKLLSEHPGVLASLAIVGAGIAVALQDVVKDVVGWMIILQRRLFTLGDRVAIGVHTGDVIDIGLLRTMMLEVSVAGAFNAHERTGNVLVIPNSQILREFVLNYHTTSDYMSVEMKVTVTYESDWKSAEKILHDILTEETGRYVDLANKQQKKRTALFYTSWEVVAPDVHVDIADSGVLFTLKFTVPIGGRRETVTKITKHILKEFALAKNVHLAYQTIQVVGGDGG